MSSVFISYRRGPTGYAAHSITEMLKSAASVSVVLDVDSIPLGKDFRDYLDSQVGKCDIFLAVIGDGWQEELKKRINDPMDFVQIEIRAALKRGIPVIPVLVGKASMPDRNDLPEDLAELAYRQATELRSGADYHAQLNRLIRGITQLLAAQEETRKAQDEGQRAKADERWRAEGAAARRAEEERLRTEAEAARKAQEESQRAKADERRRTEVAAARKAEEERRRAQAEAEMSAKQMAAEEKERSERERERAAKQEALDASRERKTGESADQLPSHRSAFVDFLVHVIVFLLVGTLGGLVWGFIGAITEGGTTDFSGWIPATTLIGAAGGLFAGFFTALIKPQRGKKR